MLMPWLRQRAKRVHRRRYRSHRSHRRNFTAKPASAKQLSRELTVSLLATLLLTFTAWAWGGVVLWTQWVVAGLGLLTLAVALLPDFRSGELYGRFLPRVLGASLGLGVAGAAGLVWHDLDLVLTQREAARQMLPGIEPPPLRLAEWGLRGLLAGAFSALVALILGALLRSSEPRRRLVRFLPFWLGLFLFAWIACQSWNTWGVVVQRDLFWRILPREHITWLPSGLDAPFFSDEEPGGMNGWRQLLILVGPWALLCALRASVLRRRSYAWLAGVAALNALGVALAGNLARSQRWKSFLGVSDPDLTIAPFGPIIYKNQAAALLCLACAAALALMFHLAKRRGDRVDRGGPHLIVGVGVVFLALGAASTMSFAGVAIAGLIILVVAPAAYLLDAQLRANLSPLPALALAALGAVVVYVGLLSVDATEWRRKVDRKQRLAEQIGADDRAPLRRATWLMVETPSLGRQLSGWGAGSYRWVSPGYLRTQPEFLNKKGELARRATHAHTDWLQAPVEWGLAGWAVVAGTLAFLGRRIREQTRRPRAPALALLGGLLLLGAHAFFDFLLFIPQLTLLAVIVSWLLALESAEDPLVR